MRSLVHSMSQESAMIHRIWSSKYGFAKGMPVPTDCWSLQPTSFSRSASADRCVRILEWVLIIDVVFLLSLQVRETEDAAALQPAARQLPRLPRLPTTSGAHGAATPASLPSSSGLPPARLPPARLPPAGLPAAGGLPAAAPAGGGGAGAQARWQHVRLAHLWAAERCLPWLLLWRLSVLLLWLNQLNLSVICVCVCVCAWACVSACEWLEGTVSRGPCGVARTI